MQLDRSHVTAASRTMLPTYPMLATILGLTYAFTPMDRLLQTPALRVMDNVVDLRVWGALFLAIAAIQAAALLVGRRGPYEVALSLLCGLLLLLAIVFAGAALTGQATPAAPVWPTFCAIACWASIRSLTTRETTQ